MSQKFMLDKSCQCLLHDVHQSDIRFLLLERYSRLIGTCKIKLTIMLQLLP